MSVAQAPPSERDIAQRDITPTLGHTARRSIFWVCVGIVLLLIVLASLGLRGSVVIGDALSPTNAAPAGSKALAEVLRQQGVEVEFTETLDDTLEFTEPDDAFAATTMLIYDPEDILTSAQLGRAGARAEHIVLVNPSFDQLQALAPDVALAGVVPQNLDADCELPAAVKAGEVSGDSMGYRVTGDDTVAIECFGSGDGISSLIQLTKTDGLDQRITVLGTWSALANDTITRDGNAALALNLLGEKPTLVWYIPGIGDLDGTGAGAAEAATPDWLTPAIGLLMLAGIAAAVWRGRRLGPLVIENLPVTVRASETMLGRARLYERSGSRLRALDALRIGTVQRLARTTGLSRHATVDEVIVAAAALSGRAPSELRTLLLDREPATDPELVQLSDELLILERDVTHATKPGA